MDIVSVIFYVYLYIVYICKNQYIKNKARYIEIITSIYSIKNKGIYTLKCTIYRRVYIIWK